MRRASDDLVRRQRPDALVGPGRRRSDRGPTNPPPVRGGRPDVGKGHVIEDNWDLPGSAPSVRDVRDRSRAFLEGRVPDDVLDDAVLVVSELATNAVLHTDGAYRVHVELNDADVLVAVSDTGGGRVAADRAAPTAVSGRGLQIVEAVSSSWGCRADGAGKTVWARLTVPNSPDWARDATHSARM
jgi:anti-sigma regulatory factor (Ser/Thr protein kinase)